MSCSAKAFNSGAFEPPVKLYTSDVDAGQENAGEINVGLGKKFRPAAGCM